MTNRNKSRPSDDVPIAASQRESWPLLHGTAAELGHDSSSGASSVVSTRSSTRGGDRDHVGNNTKADSSFLSDFDVLDVDDHINPPGRSWLGCMVSFCCFCVPYSWVTNQNYGRKREKGRGGDDESDFNSDGKLHVDDSVLPKGINGAIATFFLLLNSMIGSGIFVQPYVFKEVGIFLALVLYLIVGTAIYTGVDLLMRSAEKYQIFDYSKLATMVMGPIGQQFVDVIIVIGNFGSLISYLLIIGTLINDIVQQYTGFSSVTLMSLLSTMFLVVPGCLIRVFGQLSVFAYFSMVAILGTFLFVVIAGPIETRGEVFISELNYWSIFQGFKHIGNIVFALGFSNSVFHAYVSIKDEERTTSTFSFITFATICFGLIVCIAFGIIGYFSFGDDTQSNVLLNFSGNLGAIFKAIVVTHLLLYLPGDFIVMRFSFFRLIGFHMDEISDDAYILGVLMTLAFITAVVCSLEVYASSSSLAYSLDLTGGIANSLTFFFFPGLIGLKSHSYITEPKVFIRSILLCIFGLALPILVTISVFMGGER